MLQRKKKFAQCPELFLAPHFNINKKKKLTTVKCDLVPIQHDLAFVGVG